MAAIRWIELSTTCERERFTALSEALKIAGVANEVEFREIKPNEFDKALKECCASFDQIRIGGELCELAAKNPERQPSTILTLKAVDSYVREAGAQNTKNHASWWPRNFLFEGIQHSLVNDVVNLDIGGAVFVLGATAEARAVIGALVRIGFKRFTICDPAATKGQALLRELMQSYFSVQFQLVSRQFITQLPGIHSIAVNTLKNGEDDETFAELFYFNFLKPGGVWLDLPMKNANTLLEAEANAVGAFVESSLRVFRCADLAWAKACFGVELDPERYLELLTK
jgi:shikimate 5-dehydrogenase